MLRVLIPARNLHLRAQIAKVELRYPAVPGSEVHETPIRRKLRAAVQRKTCLESVNRVKRIAVQHSDVVITGFHHHEEIQRVGVVALGRIGTRG